MALDSPVDLGFPIGQSVKLSEGRYQVVHMGAKRLFLGSLWTPVL